MYICVCIDIYVYMYIHTYTYDNNTNAPEQKREQSLGWCAGAVFALNSVAPIYMNIKYIYIYTYMY